jgi:hypothetical protein
MFEIGLYDLKHQQVFEIPLGLLLSQGENDHGITLIIDSLPPNVHPYRHSFALNNEIQKFIQELLET